jgi:hypothetical protein
VANTDSAMALSNADPAPRGPEARSGLPNSYDRLNPPSSARPPSSAP